MDTIYVRVLGYRDGGGRIHREEVHFSDREAALSVGYTNRNSYIINKELSPWHLITCDIPCPITPNNLVSQRACVWQVQADGWKVQISPPLSSYPGTERS